MRHKVTTGIFFFRVLREEIKCTCTGEGLLCISSSFWWVQSSRDTKLSQKGKGQRLCRKGKAMKWVHGEQRKEANTGISVTLRPS